MARLPRLVLPGVALHIIQRGNNRMACFREDSDRFVYLMHLKELAAKTQCSIHAYCLMGNHVHLLMTPSSVSGCISLMRDLGQRYVQYFNRHHGRTGTLWEGRFRSCLVESPTYVLACYRYIELNPVRAAMVESPHEHRWSSHAVNTGRRADAFIEPHQDFRALGGCLEYARLFPEELSMELLATIRDAVSGGYPLCSDAFRERIAADSERPVQRSKGGRPSKVAAAETGL